MFPVVDPVQKIFRLDSDPSAKDGLSEQVCCLEQVNGVNRTINTTTVNTKLSRPGSHGPVMIIVFTARHDPESIRKVDNQIFAFCLNTVRPAIM